MKMTPKKSQWRRAFASGSFRPIGAILKIDQFFRKIAKSGEKVGKKIGKKFGKIQKKNSRGGGARKKLCRSRKKVALRKMSVAKKSRCANQMVKKRLSWCLMLPKRPVVAIGAKRLNVVSIEVATIFRARSLSLSRRHVAIPRAKRAVERNGCLIVAKRWLSPS